tara:strand:- start:129 stop:260 length:132 start_codon:yes stop_codon:yes gene_type:complete
MFFIKRTLSNLFQLIAYQNNDIYKGNKTLEIIFARGVSFSFLL